MRTLAQRQHTGKKLPHAETHYGVLAFLVLLAGVILAGISPPVKADPPPVQQDVQVGASVFTAAPTITKPVDGQHFGKQNIAVGGGCIQNIVVEVFKNNVLAGSAVCDPAGHFSINIDLFDGRNSLVARHYRPGPVSSDSNTVAVYYDKPTPPVPPTKPAQTKPTGSTLSQFIIRADDGYKGVTPGEQLGWAITLSGGQTPYAIGIDWGDGGAEVVNVAQAETHLFQHQYAKAGDYKVVLRGQDAAGQPAYMELVTIVKPALLVQATKSDGGGGPVQALWPLYLASAIVLFSFWLGERFEKWNLRGKLSPGLR